MRASKLDALETIAVQRAIFADEWVVSHPNSPGTPKVVRMADGKTGQQGLIHNGMIQTIQPQPGIQTPQAIDRLERAQRIESGIPAELGGESGSNIRTARRGEMVLGAAVDMPIQEAQEILEVSLEAENRRAVAIQKAYYGSKTTSFYVGRDGKTLKGADTYTPEDIFETDINYVKYSMAGSDMNGVIIGMGQRVGLGTMSTETFMEVDPMIEDVHMERSRIVQDGMRKALLASVEQGASTGSMPPNVVARILKKLSDPNVQVEDAIDDVHNEMQKEQSDQQQAQAQQAPGAPTPPDQQPGIAAPPGGPPPAIGPPSPSSANLAAILGSLRAPANQSGAEKAIA
jgi:hypothetical protein